MKDYYYVLKKGKLYVRQLAIIGENPLTSKASIAMRFKTKEDANIHNITNKYTISIVKVEEIL